MKSSLPPRNGSAKHSVGVRSGCISAEVLGLQGRLAERRTLIDGPRFVPIKVVEQLHHHLCALLLNTIISKKGASWKAFQPADSFDF